MPRYIPITPNNDPRLNYRFYQSSATTPLGTAVPVSAEFRSPVTITHTTSVSTSNSFSAGASVSASRQDSVTRGASFSWTRTSTSQATT